jgi:hypothetical protein
MGDQVGTDAPSGASAVDQHWKDLAAELHASPFTDSQTQKMNRVNGLAHEALKDFSHFDANHDSKLTPKELSDFMSGTGPDSEKQVAKFLSNNFSIVEGMADGDRPKQPQITEDNLRQLADLSSPDSQLLRKDFTTKDHLLGAGVGSLVGLTGGLLLDVPLLLVGPEGRLAAAAFYALPAIGAVGGAIGGYFGTHDQRPARWRTNQNAISDMQLP